MKKKQLDKLPNDVDDTIEIGVKCAYMTVDSWKVENLEKEKSGVDR